MGNYRSRLDIIASILRVVSQNPRKTQIMYQANLSYKVLQRYLAEVMGAELVSCDDGTRTYRLTNKGAEFLEAYEKFSKKNKHVEKRLNEIATKKKVLEKLCEGN